MKSEKDPAAQSTLIEMLCNAYKFPEAERVAEKALGVCGDSPRVRTAAALAYAEQGKWDDALREVEAALDRDKSYWWALRSNIEFRRRSRRFNEAEEAAGEAVGRRGYDPRAHIAKGWVLSRLGKYDRAVEAADEALRIDRTDSWALCSKINFLRQARRFSAAEQAVAEARGIWPNDPDLMMAAAWVASDQDMESEAAALATQALGVDEYHAPALAARLHFLRWAREFGEAEQAASAARDKRRRDPNILAAAGWVYSDQDKHPEALAAIREARELNRHDSWLVACHVNFLRAEGEYGQAEEVIDAALASREFCDEPYLLTLAGWLHGDRDDYPAALTKFEQALAECPTHQDALQWKTVTLRCLMKYDEAAQAAQQAAVLRPQDAELTIERGRSDDARNQFDDAIGQYDAILAGYRDPGNVDALMAKSSALRSQRRYRDAGRDVISAWERKKTSRDLLAERGWILYDQRNLIDARAIFKRLLDGDGANDRVRAVNRRERALARYGLGWVAFADRNYVEAEAMFAQAVNEKEGWPHSQAYQLGLAWSLAKQDRRHDPEGPWDTMTARSVSDDTRAGRQEPWDTAEDIARKVAESRPDPVAHACLGFLAFRREDMPSAEYHLRRAVDVDRYHGSYTDLGAFYLHTARYAEARDALAKAIARDWHDPVAHVEMGCVHWALGDGHLAAAEQEFRQAQSVDPGSVRAATGLARTLVMQGRDAEAEVVLRDALARMSSRKEWRIHLALARLLAREGISQQEDALLQEAFANAQQAIAKAPREREPRIVAGLVQFHWGTLISEPVRKEYHYGRARRFLRPYRDVPEAMRYLAALKGERSKAEPAIWGGIMLGVVSMVVLAVMWGMFFFTSPEKVSDDVLIVNTPVLLGLVAVSGLLPALIRLKVPGFEADLQPGYGPELIGPTGDDSFGPGRLAVPSGPSGQIGQLGDGRLQHAKNTRH
jgi:tetratricopeptide (TPR) repeat protein